MATQISFESFERLLHEDNLFIDYLNKFCALPLFGQRIIYRKKIEKFICEPNFEHDPKINDIIQWIWKTRLPFFFRSHIYAEYKLAKALLEYDLNEDGGVEDRIAKGMEQLQLSSFSKMSRFSKFCKFLSETGEGLKLVAFFIAAQHVFVAYYEGDPDFAVQIGELRDKFFDETSYWCLPKKVLENFALTDQATSVAFCMTVSQRVLSRICLYWLPRYLLHLRLNDVRNNPENQDKTKDESRQYLHDLIFRVQEMEPESARGSISTRGFELLAANALTSNQRSNEKLYKKRSCILEANSSTTLLSTGTEIDALGSFTDLFPSRQTRQNSRLPPPDRKMTAISKRGGASISVPGCDIKVERKKSKRPTMAELSTAINFGLAFNGNAGNNENVKKTENRLTNIRATRQANKESRMLGTLNENSHPLGNRQVSKSNMRKASGMKGGPVGSQSVTSGMNRIGSVLSVSKAISKFKFMKDKIEKKSSAEMLHKASTTKPTVKKSIKHKKEDGIGPQMKSVIKFKTADIANNASIKVEIPEEIKEVVPARSLDSVVENFPPIATKFSTVIKARNIGLKWAKKGMAKKVLEEKLAPEDSKTLKQMKSKINGKPQEKTKLDHPATAENSGLGKSGLKMVFAMSDQAEKPQKNQQKTIKVLTKKDNRLVSDVINENLEPDDEDEPIPENYLRNRRNAVPKIKPVRTLRKRHHNVATPSDKQQQKVNTYKKIIPKTEIDNSAGKRKADFIKKALMVQTLTEKIKAPDKQNSTTDILAVGDNYVSSIYSMHNDEVYRHEQRHLRAALRSDDFAAGPFMTYLTETNEDESGMFALCFWQEIERFREEFSGMQQTDRLLTMDQIFTKYLLNDRGCQLIPGMKEIGLFLGQVDILECLTFPWPLRLIQRKSMDYLGSHWNDFAMDDCISFHEAIGAEEMYKLSIESVSKLLQIAFEEEIAPLPDLKDHEQPNNQIKKEISRPISSKFSSPLKAKNKRRKSRSQKSHEKSNQRHSNQVLSNGNKSPKNMGEPTEKLRDTIGNRPRTTMGYRLSQIKGNLTRDALQTIAMAKRVKRAYLLSEQTCRLSAKIPNPEDFLSDESDEEGFVKPKSLPVYLRPPKIGMKTLALLSAKEYPSKVPKVKKITLIDQSDRVRPPAYMKAVICKNGVVLKRPMLRPKHLVDCLRDPVHFEFFRRFSMAFNFERSVRFWKAVEVMKHVEDPKLRQMKIRVIVNQFFSKGATTGVGVDGQVMREIMRTVPEKVNVSMLISAQACVMKALEDIWGEKYLSTFTDVKKSMNQKTGSNRKQTDIMKMTQSNGKMTSIWIVFYAFIKRSAKFISSMRNRNIRQEFEIYLQTIGRDPTVYHKEGWSEICASNFDHHMNQDLMYHQKKQQGRIIIAELLINDFRFWCEVECYRSQAEHVQQNGDNGMYSAIDEKILHDKAKLICDQFLNSPIPPKCRINIQSELSSTVIENVKLGMFNRSLFHDLTLNIFPLLLNYWKIFSERRHKYVPRADIRKFKRDLVIERQAKEQLKKRKRQQTHTNCIKIKESQSMGELRKKKQLKKIRGDEPLIDYCDKKRYSQSWTDVTKTMDDSPCLNFTLATGLRSTMPLKIMPQNPKKNEMSKISSYS